MAEQLSLFQEENVAHNEAFQRLLDMDFTGALQAFQRYEILFPSGRDVTTAMEQASFLDEKLAKATWADINPAETERRYQIWMEFEGKFGWPWKEGALEEELQVQYFIKLANGLAVGERSQLTALPGGTPLGLIYLLAHRPNQATSCLQALIAECPENARAYGYLGDAYFIRGDVHTARICYREAFVMAPHDIDVRRLQDMEIRDRLAELEEERGAEGHSLAWFPSIGQLEGIFERRIFRDLETMKHWLDRYIDLLKVYKKQKDRTLIPQLFYISMVLSDNAGMLQYIKKVDLVEIRRGMKEWHPSFFARHMRLLERIRT